MLKYYGMWEEGMSKEELAQTVANLKFIREGEAKANPMNGLFKKR